MSIPRECVREYIEASKNLLKLNDLTDEELELVQDMLDRLLGMLSEQDGGPSR